MKTLSLGVHYNDMIGDLSGSRHSRASQRSSLFEFVDEVCCDDNTPCHAKLTLSEEEAQN